jgi:hypothetical protein
MKSINITMPEELLDYVQQRTKEGGVGTQKRLLEGVKSPRSRVQAKTFFKRMHALIDEVAEQRQRKRRNGKATRSASRG